MGLKRYFIIPVILTKDKQIISLWREDITCYEGNYNYWIAKIEGSNREEQIVEGVFDIKNKQISLGVEVNYYPEKEKFKKGDRVCYESDNYQCKISIIQNVIYKEYDLCIVKGNKLEYWESVILKEFGKIDEKTLYCIKSWKPFFQVEDGTIIEWQHKIRKIVS